MKFNFESQLFDPQELDEPMAWEVILDGTKLSHCFMANELLGEAQCYVMGADGHPFIEKGTDYASRTSILRGRVEIRRRE